MNTEGKAMDHGSWGLQVLTRSSVGRLAHTKLSCQFASRTATQLFTQSLTTDATAASVLESSIIESDKELMMPKRSVVSSDRAAKYHRLTHVSGDGYIDLQFEKPPPKVPYKAIMLATVLFLVGSVLIIIGALLLAGIISSKYADRTWPVLIIGALMFIPGVYHVRIAYYAFRGYQGFSYEDIPEFD